MRNINLLSIITKYLTFTTCFCILFASCKQTDKNFSLQRIEGLTEIVLSQDSQTTKLVKGNNTWMVDSSYKAGEEQVDILLYIINTQHVASQIPEEQADFASAILEKEGIIIKAYEEKKIVLDITVAANDSLGYFGRSEDNKKLYRLNLPDIADNPISFLSAMPSFWKHNAVISALPSEISTVNIDNLEDPEKSFRITRETDGTLSLFDIYNREEVANISQTKLNTYLGYYNGLSYEQILNLDSTEQQAILLSDSPYKLSVILKNGEHIDLQLFYITGNENLDAYGNALKYDPNQFYLSMNDGRDIAIAKWVNFDLLLRELTYFVEN